MHQGDLQAQARELARWLKDSKMSVALTGAGISVDSGIPAFRGAQGLWERYDPMEYATIEAFRANPAKVWAMLKEMDELIVSAKPNPAHIALAELERMGKLSMVITQNVDGLHQAAGNTNVVEFHGSGRSLSCIDCGRSYQRQELTLKELPPKCICGGILKPDVVLFGEPIPERAAMQALAAAGSCSLMLVVGTSAVVAPASYLPSMARQGGAKVVEINTEPTGLTGSVAHMSILASASEVLPMVVQLLKESGE